MLHFRIHKNDFGVQQEALMLNLHLFFFTVHDVVVQPGNPQTGNMNTDVIHYNLYIV